MDLPPIRIPRERVGVLIGPNGETKADIEARTGVHLEIDSEGGEINFDATNAFNPGLALEASDIVKAIGRGFAPERALRLLQMDAYLEIHYLEEMAGKRGKSLDVVKARIIGSNGRTRITIEEFTGAFVSVYGKTVGIIGEPDEMQLAREAIEMICRGAPHSSVYKFLDKKRRELRLKELGLA